MIAEVLLCLTLNSYHEARGEPFHGQIAVNQVAFRRAALDPLYVCDEILRPNQFSWTTTHPFREPAKVDIRAWDRAEQAARAAYVWATHGVGQDYSRGATHYHATHVRPSWTRCAKLTVQIKNHRYYKDVKPCSSATPTRSSSAS